MDLAGDPSFFLASLSLVFIMVPHKLKNLYSNTFNAIETTLPLHYPGR
jgi:hypothetical protein